MLTCANRIAKIVGVNHGYYSLDIDNREWCWTDRMFDPDYKLDEPLSTEDAIRAMLDGETLYDSEGNGYFWFNTGAFKKVYDGGAELLGEFRVPDLFYNRPKRSRPMSRWERLAWAGSEASRGWVVRTISIDHKSVTAWELPQKFSYEVSEGTFEYQRARLLPDLSGVDEDTIQRFEVGK
jgi:hypothetical protein